MFNNSIPLRCTPESLKHYCKHGNVQAVKFHLENLEIEELGLFFPQEKEDQFIELFENKGLQCEGVIRTEIQNERLSFTHFRKPWISIDIKVRL